MMCELQELARVNQELELEKQKLEQYREELTEEFELIRKLVSLDSLT